MEENNHVKAGTEIRELVSSKGFQSVTENIQEKALNSIEIQNQNEGGRMGRFFGTKKENAAMNIAFMICCILFVFCLIDIICAIIRGESAYTELIKAILPIITLTLGYIFGKGEK